MKSKGKLSFLKNPGVILLAIAIAIALGLLGSKGDIGVETSQRDINDWISTALVLFEPLGRMYLSLLKMTVYPILIAAIVSSIAGLVKSPDLGRFLSRMLVSFIAMLLITALLGTLAGLIGEPGVGLSDEARAVLSKSIEKSEYKVDVEVSLSEEQETQEESNFIHFIANIIPNNIFKSLVNEMALQLVLFSIMFGIAVGVIRGERSDSIIVMFEGLFKAFQSIIGWLMYLLPFGLIFLLAGQIASSQKFFEVLKAMIRFIVLFHIVGLAALTINTFIIWRRSKEKLSTVFKALLDPIIIALATRSSFATLPAAMKALDQRLGFFEKTTKLYVPLGITLGRFGNIIYFALAALFVSQLYAAPLSPGGILIVLVGSILAGTATAGATGLATLGLMSIVLEPLGLPVEAVLILFMTIDTIIDPMRTLLIVHTNMAVNAMVAKKVQVGNRRRGLRGIEEVDSGAAYIENISARGEIVAAIRKGDIPLFHFRNGNGTFQGVDIDIAELIANRFQVKLRINQDAETEEDIIHILNSGEADFAATKISADSPIKKYLSFSRPYLSFHKALLLNRDMIRGKSIEMLISQYNGEVGVVRDKELLISASKIFPKARIIKFSDYNLLANAIMDGKLLGGYGNELDLRYATRDRGQRKTTCAVFRKTEDSYVIALPKNAQSAIYMFSKVITDEITNISAGQFIAKYTRKN